MKLTNKFLVAAGISSLAFTSLVSAADLTIYTALEDDQIAAYTASFTAQHPDIKLNYFRNSTGIVTAKLLAEAGNPQADLVWGLAATSLLQADQKGILEPYSPKGIEKVDSHYKDSRKPARWVGIDAWMTAIAVNTKEMEGRKLAIPHSLADLTKPEYKGLIVMPNPASSGTGFLFVAGVLQSMGEKKGWEFLDKLHENIARYLHSGSQPAKLAASGEFPIGISFDYRCLNLKAGGAPIDVVFPKEGSGWDLEANALVKKSTMKPEAKVFLDWAISQDVMKEYGKNFGVISVPTAGVTVPAGFPAEPTKQMIKNDFGWAAKNRDQILAEWTKRYDAKSDPKPKE